MDYKEKYEKALERARKSHDKSNGFIKKEWIETIFPELAESEDKKIRKEIINYFKCQSREEPSRKDIHNKWIAWLEKQGEKQDYNPYKATIESIAAMVEKYANGDLKDFYDNIKVKCKDAMEYDKTWNEKQDEQKIAWSEEDEKMMQCIHKYVKASASNFDYENIQIWFRNIKNRVQSQWRPTEEQMRALSMAYKDSLTSGENLITQTETLKSLYNDLKALNYENK